MTSAITVANRPPKARRARRPGCRRSAARRCPGRSSLVPSQCSRARAGEGLERPSSGSCGAMSGAKIGDEHVDREDDDADPGLLAAPDHLPPRLGLLGVADLLHGLALVRLPLGHEVRSPLAVGIGVGCLGPASFMPSLHAGRARRRAGRRPGWPPARRRRQQHQRLQQRIVLVLDRLTHEPAEARVVEDRLDEDRAAEHAAEGEREAGDAGQQRVAGGVPQRDVRSGRPLALASRM